jgi:hypothetical protein
LQVVISRLLAHGLVLIVGMMVTLIVKLTASGERTGTPSSGNSFPSSSRPLVCQVTQSTGLTDAVISW